MIKIFNELIHNQNIIEEAKTSLVNRGIVDITQFFNKALIKKLNNEVLNIFEKNKQRKDILMKQTGNTPRNMYSVSQSVIHKSSTLISSFYNNSNLLEFLSNIALEKIMVLPWEAERYLINGLSKLNDTQGWHWDDYAYALVLIAKSTKKGEGAQLECIPNSFDEKMGNSNMHEVLLKSKSHSYSFGSGSFYLMKSDTTLHRVSPIAKENALRVSLAMALCNENDLLKEIDHETIYELYGV